MSGAKSPAVGSVYGTGADMNIRTVGFRPRFVQVFNVGGNAQGMWSVDMADDSMQKAVDSGAGATDISLVTSNGITPLSNGFALGADTDVNVSGELVHWVAFE